MTNLENVYLNIAITNYGQIISSTGQFLNCKRTFVLFMTLGIHPSHPHTLNHHVQARRQDTQMVTVQDGGGGGIVHNSSCLVCIFTHVVARCSRKYFKMDQIMYNN